MNKTRRDWSGLYKCCKGKRDSLTAFYGLASAILIIAMTFYCAVYYIGIKYPSTETLDERDVAINDPSRATEQEQVRGPSRPGPSSSSASASRPMKSKKTLSINADGSDDDEILTGGTSNIPPNNNLITLEGN
jgi:hypothetical protein